MNDLWLRRAITHYNLGQFEQAEACAREHLNRLGNDSVTYFHLGLALAMQGKREEAADAHRRGLDDDPRWAANAIALCHVLPQGGKAELRDRFARLQWPEAVASRFAEDALALGEAEGLALWLDEWARRTPDNPEVSYYTSQLHIATGAIDEAVAQFHETLKRTEDKDQRSAYLSGFLGAMRGAGHALRVYEAMTEPDEPFRILADALLSYDLSTLECLIAAHRQRRPADVWLNYYSAQLHETDRRYDEADRLYAEAMRHDLDPDTREVFRWARVNALLQAGRGLWAYENVGPATDTFPQVAHGLRDRDDTDALDHLVRLHRQREPKDESLPLWEAEVLVQRKQFAEAADHLRTHGETILSRPELTAQYRDLHFRSLVRAGRFDDALREANADLLRMAIVHAAQGDVAATGEALHQCVEAGHSPSEFYTDEDLGPALRSERFKELRDKYAEPMTEPNGPP